VFSIVRHAIFLSFFPAAVGWAQFVNPGFDTPNTSFAPPNYTTSISGSGNSGPSSASGWSLYNNSASTTTTSLLASTAPTGSGTMISLTTGGFYNGLYQIFSLDAGGALNLALDINVSSGQLYFASYKDSGQTLQSSTLSNPQLNGQWQTIYLPVTNPFNEIVIYSGPEGGANFSVDNLRFVPEPPSVVLLAAGGAWMLLKRRQAKRRTLTA
jgi:hypothetical protein